MGSADRTLSPVGAFRHLPVHLALDGNGWVGSNLHVHASPPGGRLDIARAVRVEAGVDDVQMRCPIQLASSDVGHASAKKR